MTYRYQVAFRHKTTKREIQEATVAYTVNDAMMQACVAVAARGIPISEYDIISIGPHPDEIHDLVRRWTG